MEESEVYVKLNELEETIENIKNVLNDIYFDEKELVKDGNAYYVGNSDNKYQILVKAIDKNIDEIIINKDTIYIMDNAFANCNQLKRIVVSKNVVAIGEKAFMGCEKLEELILPNGLIKIGKNFVSDCKNLKYNTYKNGNYLGNYENPYLVLVSPIDVSVETYEIHYDTKVIFTTAFEKCELLTKVSVPENVTSICTMAFSLKNKVSEVTLPSSVKYIDDYAFMEATNIRSITLPNNIEYIKEKALIECNQLEEINVDKENKNYESEEGVLYSKGQTRIVNYPMAKKEKEFKVKDSVEEIANFAFSKNKYLKEIKLNNNLKRIGQFSFENSKSLQTINFNKELKEINTCAFFGCKNLQTINFQKDHQCEFIQRGAFSRCENLKYFIVTDSVKKIGINAFSNCDQLDIYLSENVDDTNNTIKKANPDNRNVYCKEQWKYNGKNEPVLLKNKK